MQVQVPFHCLVLFHIKNECSSNIDCIIIQIQMILSSLVKTVPYTGKRGNIISTSIGDERMFEDLIRACIPNYPMVIKSETTVVLEK